METAHLSASSRMTILWRPGGSVTFFWANILILLRTTSMPLRNIKTYRLLESSFQFCDTSLAARPSSRQTAGLCCAPGWCPCATAARRQDATACPLAAASLHQWIRTPASCCSGRHHIDRTHPTPVVGGVQLKHALLVAGPQQAVRERQDARRLAGARRSLSNVRVTVRLAFWKDGIRRQARTSSALCNAWQQCLTVATTHQQQSC